MSAPGFNKSVEIKLDENGRVSTDPGDLIRMSMGILATHVVEQTEGGTKIPNDMKELGQSLRDLSAMALMDRKINVEAGQESVAHRAKLLAETVRIRREQRDIEGTATVVMLSNHDPMEGIQPPPATLVPGEGAQGAQSANVEDFITD